MLTRRGFLVGSATTLPVAPSFGAPAPAVQDLTAFGNYLGEWPIAGVSEAKAQDIVSIGKGYYFCVVPHKMSPVFTDTDHWERFPVLKQSFIFDDRFDRSPGPLQGRKAGRYTWTVTGAGFQSARISSGYLTAAGNTYFLMNHLGSPITEFGAEASSQQDSFTLAIGGGLGADIFNRMLHVHFGSGGAAPLWWDEGQAGQVFQGNRFLHESPYETKAGAKRTISISIRGNFLFAHVDGKQALALCNAKIPTLCEAATEIYLQNHLAGFGAERQYRAWCKIGLPT